MLKTVAFLDGSKRPSQYCIAMILEYVNYSGLNMNFEKIKETYIGNLKCLHHLDLYVSSAFWMESNNIYHISININIKTAEHNRDGFTEKNEFNKYLMGSRVRMNLTTSGRIVILRPLILSNIIFIWISLPVSETKMLEN